ncbi:hypothetical protein P3X46_035236 [Hevea brasiliensis]|uniref:Uncharacterized protein n=2 Tax=Hevea brasiliensis TaxID=3981 RepID=A0ABQ9KD07_HEVBR|nr:uncharacterized protein LOC131168716 isoform X1 [Hevea brasiliensis]KAF2299628.1 hypothetical protein GH714_000973 [Hevea brasiliensis]KAJ9129854.1 hypothetical protein P3X46_035236 [Hevea brasiliensis]
MNNYSRRSDEEEKGLLWKLPEVRFKDLGKVGPAFGLGAGCGVGFGVGLIGGVGLGPGIPGLQMGFGFGAGCGIGYGFGYGVGRGVAHDENRRYSNVGTFFHGPGNLPTQDEIGGLIDELVINTKKLVRATSREIEKWRK